VKATSLLAFVLAPWAALADPDGKAALSTEKGAPASHAGALVRIEGKDPSFAELLERGTIKPGERFFKGKVPGSRVRVNHGLLGKQIGEPGPIPRAIGIHTQASGGIKREDFANWTRWYQEDGDVQVFRLFQGEQNVRGGAGKLGSQGRVEAYTRNLDAGPDNWREWEGTYTIIKPVGANIFQLFHNGKDQKGQPILWPFHIRMTSGGDIYFHRRRAVAGIETRIVLATHMTGKSLGVKVRANGKDYEVYRKDPPDPGPWKLVTKGSHTPATDDGVQFRWGMYVGSKKGQSVPGDAMILVTGVKVR
jgi:hypothetical protein